MRLLVIEDNRRLAEFVKASLQRNGFTVDVFDQAGDGVAALETTRYDAVVLDLGLPDADGREVLRRLRSRGAGTPVLILTARDELETRVETLNAGADDYLVKPFAVEELIARLRALLRRPGSVLGRALSAGNLSFDAEGRELRVDGKVVPLSRRELGVLEHLLRRQGRVVPKDGIAESLYGFDDDVTSNPVEVCIHRLRKRLADAGATVSITTLRGIGY
ncbi:MAG: response regulator transcription factor, partial [Proteobacteria bacterium]|nr:response regulator transcription factor [Pseudomonadota bacterium]